MNTERVELKHAIADLRRQVKAAVENAKDEDLKFTLDNIELELTVVAEDSVEGGGEVGWWIFKANAKASAKDIITHKVTVTLTAGNVQVGSRRKTG